MVLLTAKIDLSFWKDHTNFHGLRRLLEVGDGKNVTETVSFQLYDHTYESHGSKLATIKHNIRYTNHMDNLRAVARSNKRFIAMAWSCALYFGFSYGCKDDRC